MDPHPNIVLVGMPGAGKSTVGVVLAKQTARDFLDTDVLIQIREERSLQEILDAEGYMRLRRIEEDILLSLELDNYVIATGGSAVYSDRAMRHLKRNGTVVFLDVPHPVIVARVNDFETRGIACRPGQSFQDIFEERAVLYRRYADITVACGQMTQDEVTVRLCSLL